MLLSSLLKKGKISGMYFFESMADVVRVGGSKVNARLMILVSLMNSSLRNVKY
jgi:hypothetical protein